MAIGPGKYDPECTRIMQEQDAQIVLVIVVDGKRGNGFSCQCTPEWLVAVPQLLRSVAADIEGSAEEKAS